MHHHFFHRAHRCADEIEQAIFMARHHHGRGFGVFGAGFFGGRGLGGEGFRTGRKLSSEGLQLVLLALLAERPSHGYELIKALEERSGGFYSPSPGMVYPALTYLEEVGYASVQADGAKKLYSITPSGTEYLDKHREIVDALLAQLSQVAGRMSRMREFFGDEAEADEARHGAADEIWQARRNLKQALRRKHRVSAEEARRIAAILKRAAAEILGDS